MPNTLNTKFAVMEQRLGDLEERNSSEHKEILNKIKEIADTIKCFATKDEVKAVDKKSDDNQQQIDSLKSWLWWLLGVGGVIVFLIVLFKEQLIK